MANRPDRIIKNQKQKTRNNDKRGNTANRNVTQKGSGKEAKIQEFMHRDITNVEHEM